MLGFLLVFAVGIGTGLLIGDDGGETRTVTTIAAEEETEAEPDGEASGASSPAEEGEDEDEELTDCEEAGISAPPRKEGACSEEGKKFVVVDEDSTLKLAELEVELLGTQKAKTVSSEYGEAKTANGTYVIFTLDVVNRTRVPVYFDSGQTQVFLYIGGNIYTEDFDVENYALDDSFVSQFKEVQPQGSQTGTVAFDVPDSVLPKLETTGNINIVNFSDEEAGLDAREVGTIRTYQ